MLFLIAHHVHMLRTHVLTNVQLKCTNYRYNNYIYYELNQELIYKPCDSVKRGLLIPWAKPLKHVKLVVLVQPSSAIPEMAIFNFNFNINFYSMQVSSMGDYIIFLLSAMLQHRHYIFFIVVMSVTSFLLDIVF